jgi:hypothetical protein
MANSKKATEDRRGGSETLSKTIASYKHATSLPAVSSKRKSIKEQQPEQRLGSKSGSSEIGSSSSAAKYHSKPKHKATTGNYISRGGSCPCCTGERHCGVDWPTVEDVMWDIDIDFLHERRGW